MIFDLPGPRFAGDDFEELRNLQFAKRNDTLKIFADAAIRCYGAAWRISGCPKDAVKDCLDELREWDANTLLDAHELLAAYWRKRRCYLQPVLPALLPLEELLLEWQIWQREQVESWTLDDPGLIRSVCLVLVQQNVTSGIIEEMTLGQLIARKYSLAKAAEPNLKLLIGMPLRHKDDMIW